MMQISEVPVIMVSGDRVSCDGGTDPRLGHPRVYLNLHKGDPVSCSYCGLRCALLHLFHFVVPLEFEFDHQHLVAAIKSQRTTTTRSPPHVPQKILIPIKSKNQFGIRFLRFYF